MPTPRRYDPKNVRMYSYEIIWKMEEKKLKVFTASDVAEHCGLSLPEACTRCNVLRRYGMIKIVDFEIYPNVWKITNWGHRYANKKLEERRRRYEIKSIEGGRKGFGTEGTKKS